MPDMPNTTLPPSDLWLTDRTRSRTGLGHCARKRYLSTAFGPTGYGMAARRQALPLATGLAVHEGIEGFARIMLKADRLPSADEVRAIATAAQTRYRAEVEASGFLGTLAGPITDETITEQSTLIAGLIWVVRQQFLPWFHQSYTLVAAEEERLHFLSCTCGAGPLDAEAHVRRGCAGVVLMIRTDLLAKRRGTNTLAYFEAKTTGWDNAAWSEQWETSPQLALGTLDTQQRYGAEVTELYILGIGKGARKKDKFEAAGEGMKRQQSSLCYGYCRPGNPPLAPDDWLPAYEWVNEAGDTKRASRQHKRRGVWELPESDWPTWLAYHGQDPEMPPEEFWVRMLPPAVLEKVCFLVGPMNRQDEQLKSLRISMEADEARWQTILWELYEEGQPWASPAFQTLLDQLVPCSWECRPFGKEHQCPYVPVCHKQEGWATPLESGHYVPRIPHHEAERLQAVARGLLVEQGADVDEEEG